MINNSGYSLAITITPKLEILWLYVTMFTTLLKRQSIFKRANNIENSDNHVLDKWLKQKFKRNWKVGESNVS